MQLVVYYHISLAAQAETSSDVHRSDPEGQHISADGPLEQSDQTCSRRNDTTADAGCTMTTRHIFIVFVSQLTNPKPASSPEFKLYECHSRVSVMCPICCNIFVTNSVAVFSSVHYCQWRFLNPRDWRQVAPNTQVNGRVNWRFPMSLVQLAEFHVSRYESITCCCS